MESWTRKQPLLPVVLYFIGGILLAKFVPLPWRETLGLTLTLAVAGLVWPRGRAWLLGVLIFLAGATNFNLHTAVISPNDLRLLIGNEPKLVTVRGTLLETPQTRIYDQRAEISSRSLAQVRVTAVRLQNAAWRDAFGLVVVSTPGILPTNLFAGQTVEIGGVMRLPKPAVAEGTFDYQNYLSQLGIFYQLQADTNDWHLLSAPSAPPLADRFRNWARQALARGLPAEDESLRLEWALTLGWKPALTEEVSEPFVQAATFHIFAVDGLRMAIIFGIFFALFRALNLPRPVCGLLLIPLIWFYTALTGWPASAIRATVMLTIVIFGWALKRPSDLVNSLFAAALIILVWQPQQLFQAGFQLSFFVVLCIILVLPVFNQFSHWLLRTDPLLPEDLRPRWQRILLAPVRYALDVLLVSWVAWLGSIPLAAYYFHIFTPVSAPANLVAVPLCALVLTSNLISLLLAAWFPAGAELFNHAGWFLMEIIRVSSDWFARWPGAFYYVPMPGWFAIGLYYLILLTVLTGWIFKSKRRGRALAVLLLLSTIWFWQWRQDRAATRLTVLPLNGGSAAYFDPPGDADDLLVDCGSESSAQFTMKPFLQAQGVNQLPRLLLTHGDMQRIGGANFVADTFAAQEILTSSVRSRSPAFRTVVQQLESQPDRWRKVNRGDVLGSWEVLHPQPTDDFSQGDDNAVVLRGTFQNIRVLLLSDLGLAGQTALMKRQSDLQADIVVAGLPMHGEPLSEALLTAIRPRVVVVTDSEFPATRRANARLRERLERHGAPVIYTRTTGAVTVTLQEGGAQLRMMDGTRLEF
jgi:competence protein ComEC